METVKQILAERGYDSVEEMELGESVTVQCEGYMDLTISRLSKTTVSVAHTYEENWDQMSDPEIVFDVSGDKWTAIEYIRHPHLHQHDNSGLPGAQSFADGMWNRNLRAQGFIDAASRPEGVVE